ncbi:MAG TPA: hypothetical protein PLM07_17650 [Candidatus Rifleibacterium sp.]|nr:hypothetical protein [Candidatus Rifleibacterium sp.]HPT47707.1 hypothetical protein [Candidatus Rifleibacterium sp.]
MKAKTDQLKVLIFTSQHKIQGNLHLIKNSRLSDILNTESQTRDFLPITDAVITDLRTSHIMHAGFISLNKCNIELVIEEQELKSAR